MGGCCSDVSEVPEIILPDPEDNKGYKVRLDYLGRGDTYEILKEENGEWMKWLNIRRYRDGNKGRYRLENYIRPQEGDPEYKDHKDEGQQLAVATADNFSPDDYHYKKPEEVSESGESNYSDSPDDPGEYSVHKCKWKVENSVKICDKDGNEIGECKVKAKGKVSRLAIVREMAPAEGEEHGRKYWERSYEPRIKKIKYTLKLNDHEDVKFTLKGSCNKSGQTFEWETANFKASSSNPQSSHVETFDGHNPCTGMLMGFICTQVLCPGDIKDGCQPKGHDDVFPPLDDLN
jgi:hypothetical protein